MIEVNKKNELINRHYKSLKDKAEENKKMIHDFKNYLQSLEIAYQNDNFKLSENIKSQIYEKLDSRKSKYKTSSDILDILLEDKEKIAIMNKIEFIFKMEIVDLSFIKEIDIIIIFGNLYDNAIEANEEVINNRCIETRIFQVNEMIAIKIENTCINELKYKNNRLCSTKKDHPGLGTSNIENIVEKYNGMYNIEIVHNKCTSTILIPIHNF